MQEPTPTQRELRTLTTTLEYRTREAADPAEPGWLEGYAAVFNQDADIAGLWKERIRPGAFLDTLQRGDLVYALFNHDPSQVLARNVKPDGSRGGLRMHEDRSGLKVSIRPYDTPTGREVLTLVQEGGIDKMSFAFAVEDEVWSRKDGVDVREITRVRLYDVSPVTFPAYEGTTVSARALEARAAFDAQNEPFDALTLRMADSDTPNDTDIGALTEADAREADPALAPVQAADPAPADTADPVQTPGAPDPIPEPGQPTDTAWEAELEAERLKLMEVTCHDVR